MLLERFLDLGLEVLKNSSLYIYIYMKIRILMAWGRVLHTVVIHANALPVPLLRQVHRIWRMSLAKWPFLKNLAVANRTPFLSSFKVDFWLISHIVFKALLEALLKPGSLLEVHFLRQGSSKTAFLHFCLKMEDCDFIRTSRAKSSLLLMYTRCLCHRFPQKLWFC